MSNSYDYIISNGHHLVNIGGHYLVIDTGSPISFHMVPNFYKLEINGQFSILQDNVIRVSRSHVESIVGMHIDGFIGMNILMKYKNIVFDKKNMKVMFDSDEDIPSATSFPLYLKKILGQPIVCMPVTLNKHASYAILDTGACVGYASKMLLDGTEVVGKIHDYSPSFGGEIATSKHRADMLIGKEHFEVELGMMTFTIEYAFRNFGCDVVIGLNDVPYDKLKIDFDGIVLSFI